ncbi:MAG: UDP-glucose 4-epimerase GalE [Clostridiales bacterium]|nr:UDP-glucose 4-epimerase GalE [Clostridiales bacterium]
MNILLTGGLGYIGSHTAVELLNAGHDVLVIDNLCNSSIDVKDRIEEITDKQIQFIETDIRIKEDIDNVFANNKIDAVIHFAGLKAVGESVQNPLYYYENNIAGTINLLQVMQKYNVKNLVFSSSATVYGTCQEMPLSEDSPTGAVNPYGRTKLFIEEMLKDLYTSDPSFNIIILRYFNPVGAHDSGIIGENPRGIPNNLMPYIARVSVGILDELSIYGDDYDTKDGTGVRDYIHVVDLACGHVASIDKLSENCGLAIYNLGTGTGYSVLEVVNEFNKVCGGKVKYKIAPRRDGDIAEYYASPKKANDELHWQAKKDLHSMCESTYNYQIKELNKNK